MVSENLSSISFLVHLLISSSSPSPYVSVVTTFSIIPDIYGVIKFGGYMQEPQLYMSLTTVLNFRAF